MFSNVHTEISGDTTVASFAHFLKDYNETIDLGEYSDTSKWKTNGVDTIRDYVYIYGEPVKINENYKHGFIVRYNPITKISEPLKIHETAKRYSDSGSTHNKIGSFIPIWIGCIYHPDDATKDVIVVHCDCTYTNSFLLAFNYDWSLYRSLRTAEVFRGNNGPCNILGLDYKFNDYGFRSGIGYILDINTTVGALGFVGMQWTKLPDSSYPAVGASSDCVGTLAINGYYLCHWDKAYTNYITNKGTLTWGNIVNGEFCFITRDIYTPTGVIKRTCTVTCSQDTSTTNPTNGGNVYASAMNDYHYTDSTNRGDETEIKGFMNTISIKAGATDQHIIYILSDRVYVDFRFNTGLYMHSLRSTLPEMANNSRVTLNSNTGVDMHMAAWLGNARFVTRSGHYVSFTTSGSTDADGIIFYVWGEDYNVKLPLDPTKDEAISIGSVIGLPTAAATNSDYPLAPRIILVNGKDDGVPYTKLFMSSAKKFTSGITFNKYGSLAAEKRVTTAYLINGWEEIARVDNCIPDRLLLSSQGTHVVIVNTKTYELITIDFVSKEVDLRLPLTSSVNMLDFETDQAGLFSTVLGATRVYKNMLMVNGYIESNELLSMARRIEAMEKKIDKLMNNAVSNL